MGNWELSMSGLEYDEKIFKIVVGRRAHES